MALPEGYKLDAPSIPEGYALDPETSAIGAAGRGALDALPFGSKGAAALESSLSSSRSGTYDTYLKELDALLEADKQQHPIAHGIGEIAGSAAPLAIPGVGEALGAETMAGRAGVGAGIGALQGASNTRAPLMSTQGLIDIAKSAGTGAVLNPALGTLGDTISSGASKLAPKLEEMANSKAVQAMNLDPDVLGLAPEDLQALGKNMRDLDLVQGSTSDRLSKSQDLMQQAGAQIGEFGQDALNVSHGSGFLKQFTDPLQDKAEQAAQLFGPDASHDVNVYRQAIANIQNIPSNASTFEALQNMKSAYGKRAFYSSGEVKDQAYADAYSAVKNAMKSIISDSPEQYQDAMHAYGSLKDIHDALKGQLQKEQANGATAKGFGMAGKLGAMVTGGNVPATVAGAAALAPTHPLMAIGLGSTLATNPQLVSKMAGQGAEALSNIATKSLPNAAVTNAVTNSLKAPKVPPAYTPVFQKALSGINDPAEKQKQMTITDFVLQSRDPNYAKAKQDMDTGGF